MREPALVDEVEVRWHGLVAEALTDFRAWRAAHPTATLTHIEEMLDARWERARVVEDAGVVGAAPVPAGRGGNAGRRHKCAAPDDHR